VLKLSTDEYSQHEHTHFHPSGDVIHVSPEDIAVTRSLIQAGELMQIEVLDHLIIGQGRWISLREQRLGW
jgi:DNA repair protein RadC